jgi:hypothetical protein
MEASMKRKLAVLAAGIAVIAAVTTTALAVAPGETPFPSPTIDTLMVTTNTSLGDGSAAILTSRFVPGSTVVFNVFAANAKTKEVLTADDVKYAYVKIPGQPNVKLAYLAPTKRNGPNFTGKWTIPSTYAGGLVEFTTRFQTKDKKFGNFVQIPVTTSQLTVVK